jgi:hypothetical protein
VTLVVNLYGGPGTGKSTVAAGTFEALKWQGINCELVTEYAKDKVWEGSHNILSYQIYIFGKQLFRIQRLLGKVDVIVTDAPILLSLVYGYNQSEEFKNLVLREYSNLYSFDVFLERQKSYNPAGRVQNEDDAKLLDVDIREMLSVYAPLYITRPADIQAKEWIARKVIQQLG